MNWWSCIWISQGMNQSFKNIDDRWEILFFFVFRRFKWNLSSLKQNDIVVEYLVIIDLVQMQTLETYSWETTDRLCNLCVNLHSKWTNFSFSKRTPFESIIPSTKEKIITLLRLHFLRSTKTHCERKSDRCLQGASERNRNVEIFQKLFALFPSIECMLINNDIWLNCSNEYANTRWYNQQWEEEISLVMCIAFEFFVPILINPWFPTWNFRIVLRMSLFCILFSWITSE